MRLLIIVAVCVAATACTPPPRENTLKQAVTLANSLDPDQIKFRYAVCTVNEVPVDGGWGSVKVSKIDDQCREDRLQTVRSSEPRRKLGIGTTAVLITAADGQKYAFSEELALAMSARAAELDAMGFYDK